MTPPLTAAPCSRHHGCSGGAPRRARHRLVIGLQEARIGRGLAQALLADLLQHLHRVVVGAPPERVVELPEDPRPGHAHHRSSELVQAVNAAGEGRSRGDRSSTWISTVRVKTDHGQGAGHQFGESGGSMLPPDTTATILPRPARPLNAAATAQAPAPSAMTYARSATCASPRDVGQRPRGVVDQGSQQRPHRRQHRLAAGAVDERRRPLVEVTGLAAGEEGQRAAVSARPRDANPGFIARITVPRPEQAATAKTARPRPRRAGPEDLGGRGVAGDEGVVVERVDEVAAHAGPTGGSTVRHASSLTRTMVAPSEARARTLVWAVSITMTAERRPGGRKRHTLGGVAGAHGQRPRPARPREPTHRVQAPRSLNEPIGCSDSSLR